MIQINNYFNNCTPIFVRIQKTGHFFNSRGDFLTQVLINYKITFEEYQKKIDEKYLKINFLVR